MRAFVTVATTQDSEAHFTYLGPSKTETPLGSGAMRRQSSLKLRAQDPCNLIYAMWRFEPKNELVVSLKTPNVPIVATKTSSQRMTCIHPRCLLGPRTSSVPK